MKNEVIEVEGIAALIAACLILATSAGLVSLGADITFLDAVLIMTGVKILV